MMHLLYPGRFDIAVSLLDAAQVRSLAGGNGSRVEPALYRTGTARTHVRDNGNILLEFYDRSGLLFSTPEDYHLAACIRFFRRNEEPLKDPGLFGWLIKMSGDEGFALIEKHGGVELKKYSRLHCTVWQLDNEQIVELWNDDVAFLFPDLRTFLTIDSDNFDEMLDDFWRDAEEQFLRGELSEYLDELRFDIYPDQAECIIAAHGLEQVEYIADEVHPERIYRARGGYYIALTDFSARTRFGKPITIGDALYIGSEGDMQKYCAFRKAYRERMNRRDNEVLVIVSDPAHQPDSDSKVIVNVTEVSYSGDRHIPGAVHPYHGLQPDFGRQFPEHTEELIALLPELLNIDSDHLDYSAETWRRICDSIYWNYASDNFCERVTVPLIAWLGEGIRRHIGGRWEMRISRHHDIWEPYLYLDNGEEAISFFDVHNSLWRHRNGDYGWPLIEGFALWLPRVERYIRE